jgi:hypothetical protein
MFQQGAIRIHPKDGFCVSRRRGALGSGSDPANGVLLGLYARGHRDFKIFHLTTSSGKTLQEQSIRLP